MTLFDYLKNIFFILILLQLAPPLLESIKKQYGRYLEPKTQVGVVSMRGVLYDSSTHIKHLNQFFKDTSIKAVLIKMECAGSASGTGQAIFNEIHALKHEYHKPIIVLVENLCACGGYYIAAACDYIIAPGTSIVGSIGNSMPYLFHLPEFLQEHKIGYTPIDSGAYKSSTNPFVDITPEQQQMLQGVSDDAYEQFMQDIAKSRKLALSSHKEWAEGRIFTGRQARKLGLIDELGSAANAIKIIKEKALIEGDIEWVKPAQPSGFARLFSSRDEDTSMFMSFANSMCTYLENRYMTQRVY